MRSVVTVCYFVSLLSPDIRYFIHIQSPELLTEYVIKVIEQIPTITTIIIIAVVVKLTPIILAKQGGCIEIITFDTCRRDKKCVEVDGWALIEMVFHGEEHII